MHQDLHAQKIVDRFRELVEDSGDSLPAHHYAELTLLIEAGLDTALVEKLEKVADRINALAKDMRHDAEFFD